jgi:hypothetical protein
VSILYYQQKLRRFKRQIRKRRVETVTVSHLSPTEKASTRKEMSETCFSKTMRHRNKKNHKNTIGGVDMGRASKKVKKVIGVISSSNKEKIVCLETGRGTESNDLGHQQTQHDSLYRNANESDVKFVF